MGIRKFRIGDILKNIQNGSFSTDNDVWGESQELKVSGFQRFDVADEWDFNRPIKDLANNDNKLESILSRLLEAQFAPGVVRGGLPVEDDYDWRTGGKIDTVLDVDNRLNNGQSIPFIPPKAIFTNGAVTSGDIDTTSANYSTRLFRLEDGLIVGNEGNFYILETDFNMGQSVIVKVLRLEPWVEDTIIFEYDAGSNRYLANIERKGGGESGDPNDKSITTDFTFDYIDKNNGLYDELGLKDFDFGGVSLDDILAMKIDNRLGFDKANIANKFRWNYVLFNETKERIEIWYDNNTVDGGNTNESDLTVFSRFTGIDGILANLTDTYTLLYSIPIHYEGSKAGEVVTNGTFFIKENGSQGFGLNSKELTDDTGLAAATTYYFELEIDGKGSDKYSITTGTAPVSYADLIDLLNGDTPASGGTPAAADTGEVHAGFDPVTVGGKFKLIGGDVVCTSLSGGALSTITLDNGAVPSVLGAGIPDSINLTAAVAEVETVQTVAAATVDENDYFWLFDSSTSYYFWFDKGTGADPTPTAPVGAPSTTSGYVVDISGDTTADDVATTLQGVIDGLTGIFSATVLTDTVTVTHNVAEDVRDGEDGAAPTTFTFGNTTQGVSEEFTIQLTGGNSDSWEDFVTANDSALRYIINSNIGSWATPYTLQTTDLIEGINTNSISADISGTFTAASEVSGVYKITVATAGTIGGGATADITFADSTSNNFSTTIGTVSLTSSTTIDSSVKTSTAVVFEPQSGATVASGDFWYVRVNSNVDALSLLLNAKLSEIGRAFYLGTESITVLNWATLVHSITFDITYNDTAPVEDLGIVLNNDYASVADIVTDINTLMVNNNPTYIEAFVYDTNKIGFRTTVTDNPKSFTIDNISIVGVDYIGMPDDPSTFTLDALSRYIEFENNGAEEVRLEAKNQYIGTSYSFTLTEGTGTPLLDLMLITGTPTTYTGGNDLFSTTAGITDFSSLAAASDGSESISTVYYVDESESISTETASRFFEVESLGAISGQTEGDTAKESGEDNRWVKWTAKDLDYSYWIEI